MTHFDPLNPQALALGPRWPGCAGLGMPLARIRAMIALPPAAPAPALAGCWA